MTWPRFFPLPSPSRLKLADHSDLDVQGTHSLGFHACEDDAKHLCERGFGCGLVNEVAAGQVDVVAGPDRQEHRALMDLNVWRGHDGQQGLQRDNGRSALRHYRNTWLYI